MPRPKGINSFHKSGTGNNQGRQRTTPYDSRCFNCEDIHSKSNYFSSPMIPVPPPLNKSVINPPQISSVRQQSSRSSQNNTRDNRCFNSKYSNSKSNYLSSLVTPVPPPFNDSFINPPQLSSVFQQSSRSSQNTITELQSSSTPGRTSPYPSNTMPTPSTKHGISNIYGWMVDVSNLTPSQWQQNAVMLLGNYHELCNTNYPSSAFVSPPPIPNIQSFSKTTISSLVTDVSNLTPSQWQQNAVMLLPPWNDPFINTTQLSSVCQQSSRSSPNTTHELQAS